MLDDGHGRFRGDTFNQGFPSSRDRDLDVLFEFQEFADESPVGVADDLDGIFRESAIAQPLLQQFPEGEVAMQGFFASSEDHGIPALQAEDGGIDGHIRTGFIDEENRPERDADAADFQSVGTNDGVNRFADGVGESIDFLDGLRDRFEAGGSQFQAVDFSGGESVSGSSRQILGIGIQKGLRPFADQLSGFRIQSDFRRPFKIAKREAARVARDPSS